MLSSSCRAASTDILDALSPLLPIVHRHWQVFRATSRVLTELLYVCSSWPSCFCSAISLMSWFLLLQQGLACMVRLTLIVFVMGGRWPYSWCFVGCCLLDWYVRKVYCTLNRLSLSPPKYWRFKETNYFQCECKSHKRIIHSQIRLENSSIVSRIWKIKNIISCKYRPHKIISQL